MPRQAVSLEELYAILEEAYRGARSPRCRTCITPLPIRRAPADDVSANWFVVETEECAHGCHVAFAEVVTLLMSEYELERSVYGTKAWSKSRK